MKHKSTDFPYIFKKKVEMLKQMNIDIPGNIYYKMSIGTIYDLDRITKQLIYNKEYIFHKGEKGYVGNH